MRTHTRALAGAWLAVLGVTAFAAWGQTPKQSAPQVAKVEGFPYDWSQRHLIFASPRSPEQARRLEKDRRYRMQQAWRSRQASSATSIDTKALEIVNSWGRPPKTKKSALKKDWSMAMGGSAAGQTEVTDMFPAKYQFSTGGQSCSDFVVFSTEQQGSQDSGQASIVGFNNLYAPTGTGGCGGTVPTVAWAFNTYHATTENQLLFTSVVLSLNGTQIAFVQQGHLVLITLPTSGTSGTLANPTLLTNLPTGSYYGCTAPCMTSIALGNPNAYSSPFYDYTNDALYVGDDHGNLYKFTPVFNGTPALVSGWPVVVLAGRDLSSPVYDSTSGLVFVSDLAAGATGYLYSVNSSGTVVKSGRLSINTSFNDAPIVDSTNEKVYYFSSDDGAATPHSGVFQLPATFTSGATGTEMTTGTASTTNRVYSGDFDNPFYTTSTGNLYVCGNPGGTTEPTLYQIPITSGSMPSGAATAGPTLTGTNTANCSPITEFYGNNGGTQDLIFLSVTNDGSLGNCNSQGCIMSFDVTTASSFTSSSTPASSAVQSGGTTGIVIDNNTADTGANATGGSQVYFQPLSDQSCGGNGAVGTGTGPCATQASQNGLSE